MRILLVCLVIQIVLFSCGLCQEKSDVIYLKNGDVRKGTIIENVPNDYIKIEASDGSIFTIKYADIQKMTKEGKPVSAVQQSAPVQSSSQGLMSRSGDFGVTVGLWLDGNLSIEEYGVKMEKSTGFLLRAFYDAAVAERLSVGAYFNFSPMTSPASDYGVTMIEFGFSIKPRFPLGDGTAVFKPGLNIGYRLYSSDADIMNKVNSMGVNLSVEIQYNIQQIFVPYFEIGFLAQPVGGNDITKISYPPIIYLGVGAAF